MELGEEKLRHLLTDTSPRTAVEAGDGHFPAVKAKRKVSRLSTAAELAAIFNESVLPVQLQQSTRAGYWSSWKTVLTWGVAHNEAKLLLPMSQDTLKAITQECLTIGMSAGTIRNLWSAIEDRHRQFGYTPPLAMRGGDFAMLELTALSPAQTRDVLMCVLGTVMCMRVNEVDQLKICDVLWRFDGGFHPRFRTGWRAASTRESRSRPGKECTRAL